MSLPHLAPVFALLLASAIKGSVILLGALAAVRLMRRRSAASRHLVWVVALASVLALPAAMRLVPGWRVMPLPSPLRPAASYLETTVPAAPAISVETRKPDAGSTTQATGTSIHASPGVVVPSPTGPTQGSSAAAATAPAFDWKVLLAGVWAAGGLLLALRLAYGLVRVWWMERRAVEITEDSWVQVADGLARRLRVGRMVTLLRESHAVVPMTWGIVHPVVLLPADAEEWDHERRTVVLAHELAHVRRWDTATQWIAHLALAVFWFHPLVWLAVREMREERERACDDAVLSIGTRPAEYADHLLDIVRSLGSSEGPAAALAMARRSQFEGRLLAILDGATSRGGVSRGLGLAALVAAGAAVVPLAAVRAAEVVAAPSAERTATGSPAAPPVEAKGAPSAAAEHPLAAIGAGVKRMVGVAANAFQSAGTPEIPPAALPAAPASAASAASAGSGASGSAPTPAPVPDVSPLAPPSGDGVKRIASALGVPVERAAAMLQPGGYADVIRAAAGIASSPEKADVLLAVLRRPDVGSDDLAALLRVTESITAAPERRDVLKAVATRYALTNATVRREFFAAVSGFAVCPERRDVLLAVLAHDPDAATVAGVIDSAREMAAEAERRDVLSRVIDLPSLTAAGVRQVVGAVREITDNAIRRDLLVKVLGRQGLTSAELRLVFTATAELPSSPEQRDVLVYAAGHQRLEGSAREAYVNTAGLIASSAERAEALSALLGDGKADAAPAPSAPARSRTAVAVHGDVVQDHGLWNSDLVIDRNNGERVVRIRAKNVERAPDGGVRSIRRGGYLTAEEITRGETRRVEMAPDGDGIHRTYKVNGLTRSYEGEGARWLAALLREFTGR
jgi:beta-lactamase regulating signal transducer with metallopeptidase domain